MARMDSRVNATPACQPITAYPSCTSSIGTSSPNDVPISSSAMVTAIGPSSPAPGKRANRPAVAPTRTITTSMTRLRYQGAEPVCTGAADGPLFSAWKTSVTTIGIEAVSSATRR